MAQSPDVRVPSPGLVEDVTEEEEEEERPRAWSSQATPSEWLTGRQLPSLMSPPRRVPRAAPVG